MASMRQILARVWPSTSNAIELPRKHILHVSNDDSGYSNKVDEIRESEYPTLVGTTYLDHAGTTPYAKSTIEKWTAELSTNLFGNPHSASAASQLSTRRIDDIRLKVLKFFHASPDDFDVVFVANATAAIKLVAEAFRDGKDGFWYGYHGDAHTSLIGCRELAKQGSFCFEDDGALEAWIANIKNQSSSSHTLQLVAYPGQSNMTGRRLPLRYCEQIRDQAEECGREIFTLLDAASLVSTAPLNLSDASTAPDFVALSFYKIFGFPDLGALIVRKNSAGILLQKRYFAGGTVDAVAHSDGGWHMKKTTLHACLEEGTLPFHNIIALDHAMDIHVRLFRSMDEVSKHSRHLAKQARHFLSRARHANGEPICDIYSVMDDDNSGPIVALNLKDSSGNIFSASEVEKLCIVKGIQLRSGGLCNPGGISRHLDLSAQQIKSNYAAGRRCGGASELMDGKPTGAIRISFGAMSTKGDLHNFIGFIQEYYVERDAFRVFDAVRPAREPTSYLIESLSVYPIKSCGAFKIPADQRWQVTTKGLAWDREWCLVHEGTYTALSQKKYPRMALLLPTLDVTGRKLRVSYVTEQTTESTAIDLDETPSTVASVPTCPKGAFKLQDSKVCGDTVPIHIYSSAAINTFFSKALGVPCCLARYSRNTKHSRNVSIRKPSGNDVNTTSTKQPQLMLSNESPILIVSSSSVDELNKQIEHNVRETNRPPIQVSASSFRANIVVTQRISALCEGSPYIEDTWTSLQISNSPDLPLSTQHTQNHISHDESSDSHSEHSLSNSIPGSFSNADTDPTTLSRTSTDPPRLKLDILGPCQRCQMLSINQNTAATQQEPFSTLAKTRRKGDGRVWFGVHASLAEGCDLDGAVWVQVGDEAVPSV